MVKKTLALILVLVVFGWTFLGIERAAELGLLKNFMASPDDLEINGSRVETPNGSAFVVEWYLQRKPLERLVSGRDSIFLFYPSGVHISGGVYPIIGGFPGVNLTVYPSGRQVNGSEIIYTVWYYDTPGWAVPKVEMVRAVYLVPPNVSGGRIEVPIRATNWSRCSVIPVILAYFHDTGGEGVNPDYIDLRPELHLGPDYPVFGNGTLEVLFDFNTSHWVEMYLGERGGWVEVRVFNATLPCSSAGG
ncbi:hypothetical protein CL1_0567 [Thermococcus cleftensis]|uniref:Uncharacterized protein n=1 Tax=Thermococcus cleftensis (strain DSM 27260 / KACC 17922 / CL1) TaxID=163003 RepID=I3ZSU0_THECF|nr:hypothetical protein [Thermococcus cleftensis]AFL94774.1 hypothetical protein CL1_0567 [Thermococcus cleftensis]